LDGEKTVLLVCRGLSEIHFLRRFKSQPGCRYILASDDLRVHLEMEKYPWLTDVCYLEQMESFYDVALDVIKYVELINQWLKSLGNDAEGIPQELLFWMRACEGGKTTQRIQDLLLLIRSYHRLLDTFNIDSIIIFSHAQAEWEDKVLITVGRSKGLEVRIIGSIRPAIVKAKLLAWMKFLAREPYYCFYILLAKMRGHFRGDKPKGSTNEIVLQFCSSEAKHIANIVPLMKALKPRGYSPLALLWRASETRETFVRAGLGAEELENFVPPAALWEAPYRAWLSWNRAKLRRIEFFAHLGLQYGNTALGPLLWPSMQSFFGEELPQRYRLWQAAKKYFARHFPEAIRLWGAGILPEGSIVLNSLQDNQHPVSFFWIMNYIDSPYESDYPCVDLFLAAGDSQKEYLETLGVSSQRIVSVGLSRYDHLHDFQKEHSPSQSRAYLNIPQNFQHYLLFDPNYALRGYLTVQEQSLVTSALLNFAREHPAVALIIKPHPGHRPGGLEELIDYFSLPNVFFTDKNMLPFHALNAADLVITKFSTIALEGMLFKRPVISVVLDGGQRFRIYGDAVEAADSIAALLGTLTRMVDDPGWRATWVEDLLQNQAGFLRRYFGNNMANSAQIAAEALDKFIKDRENEQ
jgi:hypothetical protein